MEACKHQRRASRPVLVSDDGPVEIANFRGPSRSHGHDYLIIIDITTEFLLKYGQFYITFLLPRPSMYVPLGISKLVTGHQPLSEASYLMETKIHTERLEQVPEELALSW